MCVCVKWMSCGIVDVDFEYMSSIDFGNDYEDLLLFLVLVLCWLRLLRKFMRIKCELEDLEYFFVVMFV